MTDFFQHLKPRAANSGDLELAGRYGELLDMTRRFDGQAARQTVVDPVTQRKVLAEFSLPAGAADMSLYEPDYPASLVDGLALDAEDLQTRIDMLSSRVGESLDTPETLVNVSGVRRSFTVTGVSGYVSGVDVSTPFQVAHLGGKKWRVSSGTLSGRGGAQKVESMDLILEVGFIGFWVGLVVDPQDDLSRPFDFTVGGLTGAGSWAHDGPTLTNAEPDSGELESWTAGAMFVPLAWVRCPSETNSRAAIVRIHAGSNLKFFSDSYSLGVPLITAAT